MANGGYHISNEEWEQMEAELQVLDEGLEQFALKHGFEVDKKTKDFPTRCIRWKSGGVESLIQIYFADTPRPRLNLWICVSQDRERQRFWKRDTLRKEVQASEIVDEFLAILETGKRMMDQWAARPEELEFATNLQA